MAVCRTTVLGAAPQLAYLEVLSPCVTYNDTYREWRTTVYDLDAEEGYNPADRGAAFARVSELREEGRLPLGMIYQGERVALERVALAEDFEPPALQDIQSPELANTFQDALQSFIR